MIDCIGPGFQSCRGWCQMVWNGIHEQDNELEDRWLDNRQSVTSAMPNSPNTTNLVRI